MAALAYLRYKPRTVIMPEKPVFGGYIGTGVVRRGPANRANSSLVDWVRFASKKAGGSSKNLGGKSPGRRYGFKKTDGNFVHAGNILATQRLMRWQPGAHVGIGTNNTLYALEDGIVRFTKEVYVPAPRSPETFKVITKLPTGTVLYKTFINVVPNKQEGKFKLVGMF